MLKLKFIKKGYAPFLPVGIYEVIRILKGEPIIKGRDGHKLRLDKPEHYKIIK